MISEGRFQDAIDLLNSASRILVTTHIKPDGDACGSLAAMVYGLLGINKHVQPVFLTPVPEWYRPFVPPDIKLLGKDIDQQQLIDEDYDLVVLVDVNSIAQLEGIEDLVTKPGKDALVIDHHVTSDRLGTLELVDTTAAATGTIVLELFRHAGWQVSGPVAQALFVAVATDTGWFQHTNTDGRALRACAELVDAGVRPAALYAQLYQQFSLPRFRLLVAMLNSLQLYFGGRLAILCLRKADFQRTQASRKDTENLINEVYKLASVVVSVLLVEMEDGRVHCSLRSRTSVQGKGPVVDVSKVAASLGGGGHMNAAGAYLDGPIEDALTKLLAILRPYLEG
ncbi:MAG: bifunctional oligoribonuclease/PAP phosphatase NrnA [Sedimentisphaerales bacterium]|jgi:phosphoesterase RecJ-like protein|nr:bifunctional oligoribonuclease/PAP phosphatase NrnA [Sedimentisphaerales bacterium]